MSYNNYSFKRVILFSHNSNLSGAPISLVQLASKLPKYGYYPLIILPKKGPLENLIKRQNLDYTILRFPGRILKFIKLIHREKALLIHVNSIVTSWPIFISRLLRKPVIWHVREYLDNKRFYAHIIHLLSNYVILISQKQLDLFKNMKRVVYIPNGIDFSAFENAKPVGIIKGNYNNKLILITYIGAIEPRKGLFVLAQAALLLKKMKEIHFVIIGKANDHNRDYKEKVISFLSKNEILDRFHFLGVRQDIPEILAESDILCHPAYIEVFGRVIVEAMASKLPVIASKVGEIQNIIEDKITGYIINPGDYKGLSEAIKKLASNKELRKKMGQKGYEKAKRQYNIDIHTKKVTDLYNRILF
ncbi:MAG: hypothetical protein DRP84_01320 [Spirochaetes bacterium]|nr:MAG: hypothetical protein DRP84_01320 [Spirochaetota bacterium]